MASSLEGPTGPTGPIIDELLCFVVNKIDRLDYETLIKLCSETYSDKDVTVSKDLIFSLLHNETDSTRFIKRKSTKINDSPKVKNLKDIYYLLQEKGTSELPNFVALDLGKLPPITFDYIDVTALLTQIENVKVKVDIMQSAIQLQNDVSNTLTLSNNELKNRVMRIEKNTGTDVNNQNSPNTGSILPTEPVLQFECTECDYKFATKSELEMHVDAMHSDTDCTQCDYKGTTKEGLILHMKTHNSEENPYACTLCEYKCTSQDALKKHMETHNDNNVQCPKCDYKGLTKDSLILHMKTHISEPESFVCSLCGYKCSSQETFQKHMTLHNGNTFPCSKCVYKGVTKDSLILHMETHNSEADSFACPLCDHKQGRAQGGANGDNPRGPPHYRGP